MTVSVARSEIAECGAVPAGAGTPPHGADASFAGVVSPASQVGPSSGCAHAHPAMKTIKSKQDFERVFKGGKRLNHPLVRITAMPSDEGCEPRVAFVAARRLGNAVCRNRCKRVLRAAAREAGYPLAGYDVILFSTNETRRASSQGVAKALVKLARRLNA